MVPSVTSPEVRQWLSEIDLSGAPSIETNTGDPPECPTVVADGVCYWTCEDCNADDVVTCPDKNVWGITFDDGPTPATPDLLHFLQEKNVKATFFLVGGNVVKYPATVAQEVQEGHHLASHTWSHSALTTLTNEEIVAEIRWTEKAIFDATGYRVRYMRPPYGDVDNRVRFVLRKMGYTIVDWTGDHFDSNDWQIPQISASQVMSTFKSAITGYAATLNNQTNGFISLEHDLTEVTVSIAKAVIPLGLARNLTITSVANCLGDKNPYANVVTSTTTTTTTNQVMAKPNSPAVGGAGASGEGANVQIKVASHGGASRGQHFLMEVVRSSRWIQKAVWSSVLGSLVVGLTIC
ncbi:chitin deacetylase [Podila verticillata]|nr:chitin deacetylase [Podila verticillata]